MKEYGIYIQNNGGKSYILDRYNNIFHVKKALYDMIALEEERGRHYFVDNDFYKNKYQFAGKLKYMRIVERETTDWVIYEEIINKKSYNKIISLK